MKENGARSLIPVRWVTMGVFVLSSVLNYLDRLTLTSLAPLLKSEFHLSNEQFGYILSAFNAVYAVAAPAAGFVIDRIGLNLGVSVAVGLWSLANMATGWMSGLAGLIWCRAALGLGESGGVPAAGKAISTYLPPGERALGNAVSQVGISVGGMLAPLCSIWIASTYGWRWAFIATGVLGFAWIPLWNLTARRVPVFLSERTERPPASRAVLRDRRLWGFVIATALGMTPYALWFNWITVYLTETNGLTLREAAIPAAIPPLFANVGGLVGGWLSLRWVSRGRTPVQARRLACLVSALCLLLTAGVPLTPTPLLATAAISFSLFWAASYSVNLYTLPLDVFGRENAALSVGMLTFSYGVMSAVFSPLAGYLIDHYGFGPVCLLAGVLPLLGYGALRGMERPGRM